ncbi:MAG: cell division protein SepF [Lachnospiraceae bacterium]|nr:cell division protein SepF [Lachnospiraceae bacterium]
MGAFDKFLNYMKIDNDDDYYDDDYYDEDKDSNKKSEPVKDEASSEERQIKKPQKSAVSVGRGGKKGVPGAGMEVVRVEPSSVEDGRKISDLLLQNKVVFLDLEGIDMNLAQRIIDFTSGATYAIDGTLQQMSKYTFVIAPPVVAVSGDFQDALSTNSSVTF